MSELSAARPYAIAAYETAVELNALEVWSTALTSLADIANHQQVRTVLFNPNCEPDDLAAVCIDLCQGALSKEQENFVKLLAKAEKLILLPEIRELFVLFKDSVNETIAVTVTSAVELSEDDKATLQQALTKRLQREPVLTYEQDASLLGGVLINAGDTVIDGSVKTQLQRFEEALKVDTCN